MKKRIVILLVAVVLMFGSFTACFDSNENSDADYTRYSTDYDPNVDSWLQIDPTDEDVEINWLMDFAWASQEYEQLIYKRTGVKVNFQTALNNDHAELNTAIAGGKLPDIISLNDMSLRVQLAEEGYCYAINKLAESYAPSLLKRVSQEHWDYYKASDGNTYTLASNFYNDADLKEFEEMGGKQYSLCDVIVRLDWLNDYIDYKKGADPSFDENTAITKPSGFIEMCKWVKSKKGLANSNPTVLLTPFLKTAVNDVISYSLTGLMEFFSVPYEDSEGNLVYQYDTEEFVDVIYFLNDLYTNKLISSSNFAYSVNDCKSQILNGKSFASIGNNQNNNKQISMREQSGYNKDNNTVNEANEYVSIMLTNEAGDAPLLMDYAGRGLYNVMITKNCKREDRIIKVLDYLMSEQGQREMIYGETEGEYYTYKIRPGEINPKTGKVSTYGLIEPTEQLKRAVSEGNRVPVTTLGLGRLSPLVNSMYARMVSEYDDYAGIVTPAYWASYKIKKTYFDNTFSRTLFRFPLDTSNRKELNKYIDRQADIEATWIEALPKMIMASSNVKAKEIYDAALAKSYSEGATEWLAFRNKCFLSYKEAMGVTYAWPKNDPSYTAPEVKLFGSADKYMTLPQWVYGSN